MHASPRPCFTPQLLKEIKTWLTEVKREQRSETGRKFRYHVLASSVDGVFNLGGDLGLFRTLIEER
ncbi:MAG: enoyl-CoA hydratase, partial [Sedimenticola sp.]